MNKSCKIICTICARAGSKGVKNKNILEIAGKPLILWTLEQAKECNLFDRIVISSDSDDILDLCKKNGADVFFKRPDELSGDAVGKLDVIRHAHLSAENHFKETYDVHFDLDATSPLRIVSDIKNAFSIFTKEKRDVLISGSPSRRSPYFNMVQLNQHKSVELCIQGTPYLRRQDVPVCFDMNASIYIWKKETILDPNKTLFSGNTGFYEMPEERSIDIDSPLDFKIVEMLLRERRDAEG